MNRRLARLALCFAAALLVVVPVQGQRTRRAPAKPPAAPASLAGSPAASFPAGTMFYAEVSDTASIIDQMGGVELVYRLVREGFRGTPTNKSTSFPLTQEEFREVLASKLAMGMLFPSWHAAGESGQR